MSEDRPLPAVSCLLPGGGRAVSGAYCDFSQLWTNHPHRHSALHEFCLVLSGRGRFFHDRDAVDLRAGSLFVNDIAVVHEIQSRASRDLRLVFVGYHPGQPDAESDEPDAVSLAAFASQHANHLHDQLHLQAYLPLLHLEAGSAALTRWRRAQALRALVVECCSLLSGSQPPVPRGDDTDALARADACIAVRYAGSLSVAEVAVAAGLGERQLRRVMRARRGCSVVEAITSERIRRARNLLLRGERVGAVAVQVGIPSASRFCHLFTAACGASPRRWQQAHTAGASHTDFIADH
ncbi:MAG: AraC family transcriptional regulator [Planctomycetota bacterium]|nr:AraC family transcriptional regulator [Planctomycetota bacterium]